MVRAPWLTQGYFKEPQKGAELWAGRLAAHRRHGDSSTSMGGVEISDRIKDVIKTGGEWISSLELESLISEHQAVLSVAVVGIADEQWGERPMALVVCEPGQYLDRKILEAHLQGFVEVGRINKWAIPKQFKFVAEIPKTSVGKINKKLIREAK